MRILQVHTRYRERGGEDAVADAERDFLESAGHNVIAMRLENGPGALRSTAQLATYIWNPTIARRFCRLAKMTRPDVAHFHNTWFGLNPRALQGLKSAGIPTVVTLHNYRLACANGQLLRSGRPCEVCVGKDAWSAVQFKCYRNSRIASTAAALGIEVHRRQGTWTQSVDLFLSLTEFARERAIAGGLPAERVVVRPNFVADPGARKLRPSESQTVLCVGRLSKEKGFDVILKAWAGAAPRGLRLLILGSGPEESQLRRLASSSVHFTGHLPSDEVNALLLSCRAVLVPSIWYEGQPLGVLESMAAGAPIIGSNIGGLGETLEPLGPRCLVAAADVGAWSSAVADLADGDFVDEAGEAARATYDWRHTPDGARQSLEGLYKSLLTSQDASE
jgi:glycosyltransferase involved in cell wall biosynthesis